MWYQVMKHFINTHYLVKLISYKLVTKDQFYFLTKTKYCEKIFEKLTMLIVLPVTRQENSTIAPQTFIINKLSEEKGT